jgi:hypothetical protein
VLFAKRLLKPEELYFAVLAGTEMEELGAWDRSKENSEVIKRFVTSTSKGLIEVRKGETESVQFIHEFINDFLLRNKRLQILDPSLKLNAISVSHDRLMACCMSYVMMKELEPLVKFWTNVKELAFNYPFLEYASTYILYHAEEALKGCAVQRALMQRVNQLDWKFEQLRSFHDSFESNVQLRYGKDVDLLYAVSLHGYYELAKAVLSNKGNARWLLSLRATGGFSCREQGSRIATPRNGGRCQSAERLLRHRTTGGFISGKQGSCKATAREWSQCKCAGWLLTV